jgi:membrane-anchored mycosin MYCP
MSMSGKPRIRSATHLCLVLAVGAVAAALPAAMVQADDTQFVKYYTVTSSYQGSPENLSEIATRFLGASARSIDIFNLNAGRKQADGGAVSDPATLHPGWQLVLPWDAVGGGVQNGSIPGPAATPTPAAGATPTTAAGNPATPATGQPAVQPSAATKPATSVQCAATVASSSQPDWAALRLAADQAWPRSRGRGELVAVIDSGVDGSLPQLTGHVSVGADIVSGTGRGDIDCLGSGTSMAGVIAAQPSKGNSLIGIAPDATIMPVRVVTTTPKAKPADEATAIEVAVSAGATVIALGSYIDTNETQVARAITAAVSHDVVVVAGAALGSAPVNPDAKVPAGGTLRVGGVGVDGQRAANYRAGGVDVVAPGVNITSLAVTGTGVVAWSGTQYAVAFVAGEAALVRAAYPDLTAAQVVHRIESTADKMGEAAPDTGYGWGLINPGASVTKTIAGEAHQVVPGARNASNIIGSPMSGGRLALLVVISLVALAAAILLVFRIRRLLRADPDEDNEPVAQVRVDRGR